MKLTTKVCASLENRGYPNDSLRLADVSVKDLIRELMTFLTTVSMGSRIVITVARDEEGLRDGKGITLDPDLEAAFADLIEREATQ
jgi:hypothetical protein